MTARALSEVTARIEKRSSKTRAAYLKRIDAARSKGRVRTALSCSNLAHGFAACGAVDKERIAGEKTHNVAIVTAYNDMLSAHQPYERFPEIIREAAREFGGTAQVAGATPAMCDGVTQGQAGMELSLFSRDVIAMSTAVALSHSMYDAALMLGICDKIVPGLMIGALSFGHLPTLFVPGGPMPSGLPNKEKAEVRKKFAAGKAARIELLQAESASYHSPGTCTFYGTANSNQMFMEVLGLHLPGSTFINPGNPLRDLFTKVATMRALELARHADGQCAIGRIVDEKAVVNAIAGLLATGGSTNHTIHLVAIARAAGIQVDWQDFADLSAAVPLLARVYPNGEADVNHFRDSGGIQFVISELTEAGLMHDDVMTVCGPGLRDNYVSKSTVCETAGLETLHIGDIDRDDSVLRPVADPFSPTGGIRLLTGNLGRSIVKVSAMRPEDMRIRAPAVVCDSQRQLLDMLAGGLDRDMVAVVRHQGVRSNGMPELHKLSPGLAVLQSKGRKVALVTDGRMSGASGSVPAAIHLSPEATAGGNIARVREGDMITFDCEECTLECEAEDLESREPSAPPDGSDEGCGREMFSLMRKSADSPEQGASFLLPE